MNSIAYIFLLGCFTVMVMAGEETVDETQKEDVVVDEEKVDYAKGSLCGYCGYCKFCDLCDADCPCEVGPGKPNCHMCKYCKYCYLCKSLCGTICQPGGVLDKVSAALVNALPSFNKEEIDGDLDTVKTWVDKEKDEL